jgi:hypothetical protein
LENSTNYKYKTKTIKHTYAHYSQTTENQTEREIFKSIHGWGGGRKHITYNEKKISIKVHYTSETCVPKKQQMTSSKYQKKKIHLSIQNPIPITTLLRNKGKTEF